MQRNWSELGPLHQFDSLFILWSFESPSSATLKGNLVELLQDVPVEQQPDFIVVPNKFVVSCGSYRELSGLGHPTSEFRKELMAKYGSDLSKLNFDLMPLYEVGEDSLFVWLIWFLSWLNRAGNRTPELLKYLPSDTEWGRVL